MVTSSTFCGSACGPGGRNPSSRGGGLAPLLPRCRGRREGAGAQAGRHLQNVPLLSPKLLCRANAKRSYFWLCESSSLCFKQPHFCCLAARLLQKQRFARLFWARPCCRPFLTTARGRPCVSLRTFTSRSAGVWVPGELGAPLGSQWLLCPAAWLSWLLRGPGWDWPVPPREELWQLDSRCLGSLSSAPTGPGAASSSPTSASVTGAEGGGPSRGLPGAASLLCPRLRPVCSLGVFQGQRRPFSLSCFFQ